MELSTAIDLIKNASLTVGPPAVWADLGCGAGLFTLALAQLLPAGSQIYAVDKTPVRLNATGAPPTITIQPKQLDFVADPLGLSRLDGVLMANSLHYVADQAAFVGKLLAALKPSGRVLMVEYDTDVPVARWVPYPLSFPTLQRLFLAAGAASVQRLNEQASLFGRANLYSALVTFGSTSTGTV